MPELPNHPHAKMLDTYRKKRPRLLRWIVYAALSIVGLLVFVFLLGLVVGKPKSDDVTTLVREASTDPSIAERAGITGNFREAGSAAPLPPPGLMGSFYWSSRPSGADAEIVTFDTMAHATAAFDLFRSNSSASLLVSETEGTTVYQEFSIGRVDSPVKKVFRCAQREETYACGSIPAGVPAIVTIRQTRKADWLQPKPETDNDDPMAGFRRLSAKTDSMADEMQLVDDTLQRLGIGEQKAKQ